MPALQRRRGFTLIELIVGLAIAGLISAAAVIAAYELLTASTQANDMQTAISQVRAAEHWMSRDIPSAQVVTPGDDAGFPLQLTWTDVSGGNHMVEYSLQTTASGVLRNLERAYTGTDGATSILVVAYYIDATASSCSLLDSGGVQVTLAAMAGSQTSTRTFQTMARAD